MTFVKETEAIFAHFTYLHKALGMKGQCLAIELRGMLVFLFCPDTWKENTTEELLSLFDARTHVLLNFLFLVQLARTLLSVYSALMGTANKLVLILAWQLYFHLLILNVTSAFPVMDSSSFVFLDFLKQKKTKYSFQAFPVPTQRGWWARHELFFIQMCSL